MNYHVLISTIAGFLFILMMIIFIVGLGIKFYILYLDKKLAKYNAKHLLPPSKDVE